ncbi:hypothetical protein P8452_42594 [Trifolium repens]|nr:hypothetical protein P8452_42594 [Trifolium repens]
MVRPPPRNSTRPNMESSNGNNNNGSSNPSTASSTSGAIVSPVISENIPNVTGATVSAPTSSIITATMAMPSSTTASSTTTEPILTLVHHMESNFSPNRSHVNGGGAGSSTFQLPVSQYMSQGASRNYPYGMPTTMMQGFQTSASLFTETAPDVYVPNNPGIFGLTTRNNTPTLTNTALAAMRQQMDDSNHDMVNMLTQQIGTVFNPLIQNTNQSYQLLANQMGRIADFFGAPQVPNQQVPQIQNVVPLQIAQAPNNAIVPAQNHVANPVNQVLQHVPVVEPQAQPQALPQVEPNPGIVLVNRNHNADDVVRNVQNNNFAGQNNISNLVETILAQNGLNICMHRPHFVFALSEFVLQTELPRGWKIPKFTKFAGDTSESIVEHIARYLTEAGNLANNENLRMKYFPNCLTKNAFTWFTTLPPHSIFNWNQLERVFHEQFYMGQSKISLKELASVRRKTPESVDDYLNRFRLLKARCFTQVPEHELVEMAAGGLDYSIRKKLDTQHLRDMAQLAVRVRPNNSVQTDRRPTFLPSGSIPVERWMHHGMIRFNKRAMEVGGSSGAKPNYSEDANKYSYKNNYKGKHPMTTTQWRRFQRQKKLAATNLQTGQYKEVARRSAKERIFPPIDENKMEDVDLLDSEPDFDVICVVSILPSKYDVQSEVTELETDFDQLEMADTKPICYYVMNNGCIEEQ